MAVNVNMTNRVRNALEGEQVEEKSMFGSVGFMVNGHLCICVKANEILYKLSPEDFNAALATKECRPMIQNGRIAQGWIFVGSEQLQTQAEFNGWLHKALSFNKLLPDRKIS